MDVDDGNVNLVSVTVQTFQEKRTTGGEPRNAGPMEGCVWTVYCRTGVWTLSMKHTRYTLRHLALDTLQSSFHGAGSSDTVIMTVCCRLFPGSNYDFKMDPSLHLFAFSTHSHTHTQNITGLQGRRFLFGSSRSGQDERACQVHDGRGGG